jgi:hypothetical protein
VKCAGQPEAQAGRLDDRAQDGAVRAHHELVGRELVSPQLQSEGEERLARGRRCCSRAVAGLYRRGNRPAARWAAMSRLLRMLLALAALLVLCPAARAATVAVDFGVSEVPRLKVGFLHSLVGVGSERRAAGAVGADRLALE